MKPHKPIPLVLCEGKEDRFVLEMLTKHAGLDGKLAFQDYGGETNLRRNLAMLKVSPEFARGEYSRVLVTRDADASFIGAWTSVSDSIKAVFSQAPASPGEWIASEVGAQISAWVISGPGETGMIETLCLDASRSNSPALFECLDPFVACLGKLNESVPHEKFALRCGRSSLRELEQKIGFHWIAPSRNFPWIGVTLRSLR